MPRRKGGQPVLTRDRYADVKDILIPYRRVSTREQADSGAGLNAQKTNLQHGLAFRQQTAYGWDFVDKGKSGKNMNREQLNNALAVIERGEAGGIIVSKLDRLSRSLLDFAMLMARADDEGWNIVALDLNLDLSTPAGKMMAGILAVFAQFERDVISQRTRDGLAEKRAEGVRLGRKRSIDDNLLEAILGAYHSQANFSATARWLNDNGVQTPRGGKMWYPYTVQGVVQSQDALALVKQLEMV